MTAVAAKGLEGVVAASTALSKVDGQAGRLIYRGYDIHDLAQKISFEEVAHLLWVGHLPNRDELATLTAQLQAERELPASVLNVIKALPLASDPMDVLRTALSAYGATVRMSDATLQEAIELTARIPVILATFHRLRQGLEPLASRPDLAHVANYLWLLNGVEPTDAQIRALNAYFVMLADHGMNASTFTGRIVASTLSDLVSSVVAALGALKGPLHGGAPSKALDMLNAIKAAGGRDAADDWLRSALGRGERLMGFGHRAYKTTDPRAEELRNMAQLAAPQEFELARYVEELALACLEEAKPGRRLYTNVEYYSAVLLASVGLPGDLFTPTFGASRTVGWTAHILEQTANNRLIRPDADYTGAYSVPFVPLAER
jgi:citrate synthase